MKKYFHYLTYYLTLLIFFYQLSEPLFTKEVSFESSTNELGGQLTIDGCEYYSSVRLPDHLLHYVINETTKINASSFKNGVNQFRFSPLQISSASYSDNGEYKCSISVPTDTSSEVVLSSDISTLSLKSKFFGFN